MRFDTSTRKTGCKARNHVVVSSGDERENKEDASNKAVETAVLADKSMNENLSTEETLQILLDHFDIIGVPFQTMPTPSRNSIDSLHCMNTIKEGDDSSNGERERENDVNEKCLPEQNKLSRPSTSPAGRAHMPYATICLLYLTIYIV